MNNKTKASIHVYIVYTRLIKHIDMKTICTVVNILHNILYATCKFEMNS